LTFSYRIEQVNRGDGKYLRLAYCSKENRLISYIGKCEVAIRALILLRPKLCDRVVYDLVHIVENGEFPFWYYKTPIYTDYRGGLSMDELIDFHFIRESILKKAEKIKPDARPITYDIDNLGGFFIEEYPNENIVYKPINLEVDLISNNSFLQSLDEKLPLLFPVDSKYSFSIERNLGRFITGRFMEKPYSFFIDVVWCGDCFKVRMLNIAGFQKIRIKQKPTS
jgi:hypothetical protein